MNEQLGESPENIQGETPMPEEEAEVADSSQSSEDILSEDLHTNIIKNNREITSFLGEIQKEMKQEGFDCGGALEKAWAMIKETENLERDNKGMISSGDMLTISTRLMLLKSLVLELEEFQRLQEQIKNSGGDEVEPEAKQEEVEKKKVVFPSEEPKNIEETESGVQESKENVLEKPGTPLEKKEKKEEDLNEQKIVDNLLRRASALLACKDALLTGKGLSDAEKDFLRQEFPKQDISISEDDLLKAIETRKIELIKMAEEGALIAGMGNVMKTLYLSDRGFVGVAEEINKQETLGNGLVKLHENIESTYYAVLTLREMQKIREEREEEQEKLSEEKRNFLDKFEKGVSVKLEGDENIKWEKKDESTDAVKISGRDVDRVQREDTNGWFFLKRLLEMAGESNHFGAIKEADFKGKVSRSRESLGNGRYRFDIEWEDATKAKNVLIITVNLGVEGRGGFWERHDIRKKKDVQVTVEEYWEKIKKEDETKIEEREPEEVGDIKDEKGVGNDEKHLSDFLLSGIREGRPIIVKKEGGVVLRYFRAGGKVYCQRLLNTGSYGESTGPFNDENEKVTVGKDGIEDIYSELNEQVERQKIRVSENENHLSTFMSSDLEEGGPVIVEKDNGVLLRYFREGGKNYYQTRLPVNKDYGKPVPLIFDLGVTVGKDGIEDIYFELNEQVERQKTEEREPEDVNDVEGEGRGSLEEFIKRNLKDGDGYQNCLLEVVTSGLDDEALIVDVFGMEFDPEKAREFINELVVFAGKSPEKIKVGKIRKVILESFSSPKTAELFKAIQELNALELPEDSPEYKSMLEKIKNIANSNIDDTDKGLNKNEKGLAKNSFRWFESSLRRLEKNGSGNRASEDNDIGKDVNLSEERIEIIFNELNRKIEKENIPSTVALLLTKDPVLDFPTLIQTLDQLKKSEKGGDLTAKELKGLTFREMLEETVEDPEAINRINKAFELATGIENPVNNLSLYDMMILWENSHRNRK
ncbi:MAG: hypothetical protein WCQ96_00040 [Patescibacteria group bacterium]